jgi:DnaJ family protein C protein 7
MEKEAKKDIPLDFCLILGIKPFDTASDIKKAYRKAALKHHPGKAS